MSYLKSQLLAQAVPPDTLKPGRLEFSNGLLLLLGGVVVLVAVFLVWALFFRKREDGLSSWKLEHSHRHSSSSPDEGSGEHHHRRRRRRRREHRPRNPTLAETGGLPPARPEPPPETTP